MKRSLILMLSWVLLLAFLCACAVREEEDRTQSDAEQQAVSEQSMAVGTLPLAMTIAETVPGCAAFEYKYPNQAYCFYAYDERGNFYRVLWTDFDGLAERDRVSVVYSTMKKLTYAEYPNGGYTPAYEITATQVTKQNCLAKNEDREYEIRLPVSGQTVRIRDEQVRFVPYIDDKLVRTAEETITEQVSHYSDNSGFYLQVTDDYLCLTAEVIHQLDEPDENVGCIDHEHLFFSERITHVAVRKPPESVCTHCGEDTGVCYFFKEPLMEDDALTAEYSGKGTITETERKSLMQIYKDRTRWTDDSVVDREPFRFDGYLHFEAGDKCGKLYFGFESNVLYFDGDFTWMYEE